MGIRRVIDGTTVESYFLIYRDVIIAEAKTGAEMERAIAPFFGKNEEVLVEVMEEFVGISRIAKNLDAVKLTRLELDEWKNIISKSGGKVRYVSESKKMEEYFLRKNVGAAFDPFKIPPTIWIRKNPSDLELFHEAMHFEDYLRRGDKNFKRGFEKKILPLGNNPQPNKRDMLISDYIKEKYVLDRILEEQQNWIDKFGYGRWSDEQIEFSKIYFKEDYELKCTNYGIDLTQILIKP